MSDLEILCALRVLRGEEMIIRTMRDNGSPEPVFEFDEYHSSCMVQLAGHWER